MRHSLIVVLCVGCMTTAAARAEIRQIDLVHFSHTDYGYTDHPAVCRQLERRYLDVALDAIAATRAKPPAGRFAWTAETTPAVLDWWQAADASHRRALLEAVKAGQLEVSALALNNSASLDARQWSLMTHWLPEDLWRQVRPQAALQSDVNGFPRAGAMALLDRQVRYLFMSSNDYCGGSPFARPSAFWWKMPDGRRMLVYLNYSYPAGYDFFEAAQWRRGPVPRAGDARYRPPAPGEIFAADEASVRKAHKRLLQRVAQLQRQGYAHGRLIVSVTNQWRIDNDPPLPQLADFVGTWNRLGLQPGLRLTTVTPAMKRLEEEVGDRLPEHSGEWPDWWSNGMVSGPREVAASRRAKRLLAAAVSPVFGPLDEPGRRPCRQILEDLCLFDEHTWGSTDSVGLPYDLDVQGQFVAKAHLAYRPMARAEWFLSQRLRTRLAAAEQGLFVANSSPLPWSGWIEITGTALREDYRAVTDTVSGRKIPLEFIAGYQPWARPKSPAEVSPQNTSATYSDKSPRQTARFWLDQLPGRSIRRFVLITQSAAESASTAGPMVKVDGQGWPVAASWPGMSKPLFVETAGQLTVGSVKGFSPRWLLPELWADHRPAKLEKFRRESLEETPALAAAAAEVRDNPHTRVYAQSLRHPRLRWATRELELWKTEPRARLTLRFYRTSAEAEAEAIVAGFALPCQDVLPRTTCGGQALVPFADQLPGTCRDYFAIDGCVHYAAPEGNWYWSSRDCPLVAFGSPALLAFHRDRPRDANRIHAILFNNFWNTNFVADSSGVMEFRFDLAWTEKDRPAGALGDVSEALSLEPPVLIQPASKADPIIVERLFRP